MTPRPSEAQRLLAITAIEREFWAAGCLVAGMDEVGRGPLAGPVVVACVCLPPHPLIPGVRDSKQIKTEARREALYEQIAAAASSVGVGIVDHRTIDSINILQATRRACALAYRNMPVRPEHVLVDALTGLDIPATQHSYVRGDQVSYLIGAASIYAKVVRDRILTGFDALYSGYGFARNKGYGTPEHLAALRRLGPCPIHRRSFLTKALRQAGDE